MSKATGKTPNTSVNAAPNRSASKTLPKLLRCAIYTRKSSEEGLEQGFNSLHAQREACEAYIVSQAGEGWKALTTLYDDGGFSGGSMERPGLTALLADIAKGKIDVVVVYKVDRLTRSLADFAKIVESFDQTGVSFVSVTQAFNTTTSMGRLTLNVLLSFAQFEREVTGERIRDKIAASKKKGMWMGGLPPLGYDPPTDLTTRALVINEAEAATVRLIFERYRDLASVHALMDWLNANAIRSKSWRTAKGRTLGGLPFERGALFHLLKNRVYIGEITHKDQSFQGAHQAIVDRELFEAVQSLLARHAVRHRTRPTKVATMMLKGLVFDRDGQPMSPTFAPGKGGQIYRYYVSTGLQKGQKPSTDPDLVQRVPAELIEVRIRTALTTLLRAEPISISTHLTRADVHATMLQLTLKRASFFKRASDPATELATLQSRLGPTDSLHHHHEDPAFVSLILPCRLKRMPGRVTMLDAQGRTAALDSNPDRALITGLHTAHAILARLANHPPGRPETAILHKAPTSPYERGLAALAFLAPDIQSAILEGRQPATLNLARLTEAPMPILWSDQRVLFGVTA
jgi:site-specific DNA recombinase